MKKLLLILMFIVGGVCFSQNNSLYLSVQPSDFGVGMRYDRMNDVTGGYATITWGNYKYPFGYINDHWKATAGALILISTEFGNTYMSGGMAYHHYGEKNFMTEIKESSFNPISFELGFKWDMRKFVISARTDILKWETCFDIGFNF